MTGYLTNARKAFDALSTEYSVGERKNLSPAELEEFVRELDVVIQEARDIKGLYKKRLAVMASQRSREARKDRIDRALALLAKEEALESAGVELKAAADADKAAQA